MVESQNIEWKEAWRDEYLKWICGFANAQGGKIYIGINDSGKVIGIKSLQKQGYVGKMLLLRMCPLRIWTKKVLIFFEGRLFAVSV